MLGLDPTFNDCIFVTFNDSLFPCTQFCNFTRSLFKFDEWEMVASSAYILTFQVLTTLTDLMPVSIAALLVAMAQRSTLRHAQQKIMRRETIACCHI